MESFENPSSPTTSGEERKECMSLFQEYEKENAEFLNEISEIMKSNQPLTQGIHSYGGRGTFDEFDLGAFADFGGIPQRWSLRESNRILTNDKNNPDKEVYAEIVNEWRKRKDDILTQLKNFSGDEKEGFTLAEKLHKEYILKNLNENDRPLMRKSS